MGTRGKSETNINITQIAMVTVAGDLVVMHAVKSLTAVASNSGYVYQLSAGVYESLKETPSKVMVMVTW